MAETKKILLRIPEQLYEDLNTLAKDECRSINGEIEYFLTLAVKERRKRGFLGPVKKRNRTLRANNVTVVRKALIEDLDAVVKIYENARHFMYQHNNYEEWPDDIYPSRSLLEYDIQLLRLNLVVDRNDPNHILGAFVMVHDDEYEAIEGAWINKEPYIAIHRIASSFEKKNLVGNVINYCLTQGNNIRMDIFEDNYIMQNILPMYGFIRCGNLIAQNGAAKIAYQLYVQPE